MNDWANYIRSKHDEDTRIAEMERKSAPLFWLVYLTATITVLWLAYDDYYMRQDRAMVSETLAQAANGKVVVIGDVIMYCKTKRLVEGI